MALRILKKSGQKTKDAITQVIGPVGEEFKEIGKQTVKEATGINLPSPQTSEVVESVTQQVQDVSDIEHQSIHKREAKKLDYLNQELAEIRRKETLEKKMQEEGQTNSPKEEKSKFKPPPFIDQVSKRKLGLPTFGKKKTKGSGEVLKVMK